MSWWRERTVPATRRRLSNAPGIVRALVILFVAMRALAVALVLLVVVSGVQAADQGKGLAVAHVRKATAAYNLGKYADAAKEYEAAYEETLDPNLLFNVAQTYRLAGDREKAITAYRSFIRSAPQSKQRGLAESKMHELEQQRSAVPPEDGSAPGAASSAALPAATLASPLAVPLASPVVPPSTNTPSPGSAAAATPSTTDEADELVAAPTAPEPARPAAFYKRWPFWTAVGAVVAGGVVLGVVLSRHAKDVTMPSSTYGTQEF